MAYLTESDLSAKIPPATLLEALDDDGDGVADSGLLDGIIASAAAEIDGQLSGRHAVPFSGDIPPLVKHAAIIFVLEMLYERRGWHDAGGKNPWSKKAEALRVQIREVGMGERPLFPASDKAAKNVTAIKEDSKITGDLGLLDV